MTLNPSKNTNTTDASTPPAHDAQHAAQGEGSIPPLALQETLNMNRLYLYYPSALIYDLQRYMIYTPNFMFTADAIPMLEGSPEYIAAAHHTLLSRKISWNTPPQQSTPHTPASATFKESDGPIKSITETMKHNILQEYHDSQNPETSNIIVHSIPPHWANMDDLFVQKPTDNKLREQQHINNNLDAPHNIKQQWFNILRHACIQHQWALPDIVYYPHNTIITDEMFAALPPHCIIIGGIDAPVPHPQAANTPHLDPEEYRAFMLNQNMRSRMNPIGYITRESSTPDAPLYWFAGYVPNAIGTYVAILRTIAVIHGVHPEDAAQHPQYAWLNNTPETLPYNNETIKIIHEIEQKTNENHRQKHMIDQQEERIQQHQRKYTEHLKKLTKLQQIEQNDDQSDVINALQMLRDYPLIDRIIVKDGKIVVYTHGINAQSAGSRRREPQNPRKIHLGRFRICINLNSNAAVVSHDSSTIQIVNMDQCALPYADEYESVRNAHAPHLRSSPCFGNVEESVRTLHQDRMYPELILTILNYLQYYNPDDSWGKTNACWPTIKQHEDMWAVRNPEQATTA